MTVDGDGCVVTAGLNQVLLIRKKYDSSGKLVYDVRYRKDGSAVWPVIPGLSIQDIDLSSDGQYFNFISSPANPTDKMARIGHGLWLAGCCLIGRAA
jgi:hypothetical protein